MAVANEAFRALCIIGNRGDQLTIKYFGANGTVHDLECEIEIMGQTGLQVRSADNTTWISAWTVVGWTVVGHREQTLTTALPDSPTTTLGQPSESVQRRLTTDLPGVAISNIGQLLGSGGAGDTDRDEPDGSGAATEGISQSHRDRKPLEERLRGLPKGNSSYARAKREEQLDNLEAAEALFRQTIAGHGIYRKSAIKDLAMLLNRLERFTDAINVLADHRSLFTGPDEPGLLQSYKAVFLKSKQYVEALNTRGQGHRAAHHSARALGGIHDFSSRLIDQFVVERLEADTNFLVLHDIPSKSVGTARRMAPVRRADRRGPPCVKRSDD
jgi:hypothetical protein